MKKLVHFSIIFFAMISVKCTQDEDLTMLNQLRTPCGSHVQAALYLPFGNNPVGFFNDFRTGVLALSPEAQIDSIRRFQHQFSVEAPVGLVGSQPWDWTSVEWLQYWSDGAGGMFCGDHVLATGRIVSDVVGLNTAGASIGFLDLSRPEGHVFLVVEEPGISSDFIYTMHFPMFGGIMVGDDGHPLDYFDEYMKFARQNSWDKIHFRKDVRLHTRYLQTDSCWQTFCCYQVTAGSVMREGDNSSIYAFEANAPRNLPHYLTMAFRQTYVDIAAERGYVWDHLSDEELAKRIPYLWRVFYTNSSSQFSEHLDKKAKKALSTYYDNNEQAHALRTSQESLVQTWDRYYNR